MVDAVNARRDAYTAYSEQGSATVNVGIGIAAALSKLAEPDAPDLPAGYQPRTSDITALKSLLIAGAGKLGVIGQSRSTGLRGMGGLGKTVLAAALVRDSDIRKTFPWGIVWLNFGREANALAQLTVLARAVTGQQLGYTSEPEARADLARILADRRLLLVLDDIWDPALVNGFRSLSPGCHLLITTREQAVLDRANARGHSLDLLDPRAARALFLEALESADLPAEAEAIIAACGGLPLALAAAASMVRRNGWAHTQEAFRRGRLDALKTRWLPGSEHDNVAVILAASVAALPDPERACFLACAIWPEDVPVSEGALNLYWSALVPDPFDQAEIVNTLLDASVLQKDTSGLVRLHDLYHDYLRHRGGANLAAMHGTLADRCVRIAESSCELIDTSDWVLAHLPWHLKEAERSLQAKALLFDFHWLEAKLAAHGVASLIADTQLFADSDLVQLGQTLRLSAHVLARDPRQLCAQLIGRIHAPKDAYRARLVADATTNLPADALVPRGGRHLSAPGALVATFAGHNGWVNGGLLLPDGRRALSWSGDTTLRLWDLDTGSAQAFEGHNGWVNGALLLPDGRRALSWSDDNSLRLWDLDTGSALAFEGHNDVVKGALLLPDGRRALSWSDNSTLRLWDLDTGSAQAFEGHNSWVNGALLLPDGRRALSWSWDNTLRLWDLDTGSAQAFEGHNDAVNGALLLPDGRRALSWSHDRTLRLWDLDTGSAQAFEGHNSLVKGALLLPDGRRALSWSDDNSLRLWDLDTGSAQAFEGHNGWVNGALLLPDGRRALSWSRDNTLRLWDLDTGSAQAFEGHNGWVKGALLLPDGRRALSWSSDTTLRLWDLDTGSAQAFEGHNGWVNGALLLPDGRRALSWSWDNTLRLWDLDTGSAQAFEGHNDAVNGALLLPDGRRALSWSHDRTLRLWDLDTGSAQAFEGHNSLVKGALLLPDGRRALSWSDDNTLRLWDVADQLQLKRYIADDRISMMDFFPALELILVGHMRGQMRFFDLRA